MLCGEANDFRSRDSIISDWMQLGQMTRRKEVSSRKDWQMWRAEVGATHMVALSGGGEGVVRSHMELPAAEKGSQGS